MLVASYTLICSAAWSVVDSFGDQTTGSVRGMSISADGKYMYVTAIQENKVYKYDIGEKKLLASIKISGVNAKAVYADATGAVWVPGSSFPSIYKLDADLTGWTEYKLDSFGVVNPEGVVSSGQGVIYVTDRQGNKGIYKFIFENNTLKLDTSWGNNGHALTGVGSLQPGITPDGDVIVGESGGSTVYKVDKNTGEAIIISQGVVRNAYHIWAGGKGNIYIAEYAEGLTILDAEGKLVKQLTKRDLRQLTEVSGVTADASEENVYFLDQQLQNAGFIKVMTDK